MEEKIRKDARIDFWGGNPVNINWDHLEKLPSLIKEIYKKQVKLGVYTAGYDFGINTETQENNLEKITMDVFVRLPEADNLISIRCEYVFSDSLDLKKIDPKFYCCYEDDEMKLDEAKKMCEYTRNLRK